MLPLTKQSACIVACFLGSLAYFLAVFAVRAGTDIQTHALFVIDMLNGRAMPSHFLYFWAVALVSLFSRDFYRVLSASAIVLAIAVAARFAVTYRYLHVRLGRATTTARSEWLLLASAFLLILAHSLILPTLRPYAGQFPPNIWHNSTTIAVAPMAVLLFWKSNEFLSSEGNRVGLELPALVALNVLTKPSFFLVFAIVFPIFAWRRFGLGPRFVKACAVTAVGGFPLAWQFKSIYVTPVSYGLLATNTGGLRIAFLHVWNHFSTNMPLSFLASTAFPLAYLASSWRIALRDRTYQYALACFAVALGIFCGVAETGSWEFWGNYLWQVYLANFILFLVSVEGVWRERLQSESGAFTVKHRWLGALLVLHAASGAYMMAHILIARAIY